MRKSKKLLAILTLLIYIMGAYSGILTTVFAAPNVVNITIESFTQGELKIRWNQLPGTRAVTIEYHEPGENNKGELKRETLIQDTNSATISNLRDDYIYDVYIKIYDNPSGTGSPIGHGLVYFIPNITFYSEQIEQDYTTIPGGGRETGDKPRLRLKWAIPKVYSGITGNFTDVHMPETLSYMQSMLNSIYGDSPQLSKLNYRINISTDSSKLDGGSGQSSILINYNGAGYRASVAGKQDISVKVDRITQNNQDFLTFDLIGKSGPEADLPDPEEFGLPDNDILPGTVYYMNIKPVLENSQGKQVGGVTLGPPENMNGSKLSGDFAYTYTPIRFQITRDYANNAYIKIYKINHGSLDLPRLYYEVQVSDNPTIQGDWVVKRTLDDTYFTGDYALTIISDINPYNELFYKIVVRTDSTNDRLESLSLPYTLYEDIGRPPTPTNVMVEEVIPSFIIKDGKTSKSTDVTISWNKPLNWEDIKNNNNADEDIVYHILMNTAQTEMNIQPFPTLEAEGTNYGNFPIKYRLVRYVSSKELIENGNRLEYTIKGFDLFKGSYFTGNYDTDGNPEFVEEQIENNEGYPDFLLPNKIYYFQIYTTKGIHRGSFNIDHMSERSITKSFTTLVDKKDEVPVVKNLRVNINSADIDYDPVTGELQNISNYVELQFEKPHINWSDYTPYLDGNNRAYYDLYMSTRPELDSFILIGSTDDILDNGDVEWKSLAQNTVLTANIRNFTDGTNAYTAFGTGLRPNTTYYFIVRTRLSLDKESYDITSDSSILLTVTTIKGPVEDPDYEGRRPLAPTDFSIASDENGNQLVSGTSVTFRWTRLESDIEYRLICTSERVPLDADESLWESDPLYRYITLNPQDDLEEGYFEYIETNNEYRFTLKEGLYPNRIYYFSLKAIDIEDRSESYWASIPVTTTLLDAPVSIEAINDYQIGFFWSDKDPGSSAENFSIYIRSFTDYSYKLLNKNQYTLVKNEGVYYGRIRNLKPNTSYSVKVVKNQGTETVYEKSGLTTRDGYHQIEVRWKGLKGYKYEIAIKSEEQDDYITINDSELASYIDMNGRRNPYYIEGIGDSSGSDYNYYYARIMRAGIVLPNGEITSLPLKSNTKYYIKVRAIKTDSHNLDAVARSKYVGPVSTRTEFSQDDYDKDIRDEERKDYFIRRIKDLEKDFYWKVLGSSSSENPILLKEDRVVSLIQNSVDIELNINLVTDREDIKTDVIYIPLGVLEEMTLNNKVLNIEVLGAEYIFKPDTIDIDGAKGIRKLMNNAGVKDILVKLVVTRTSGQAYRLPNNTKPASKVISLDVQALGITKNQKEIKELIHDRLYNEETGITYQMLNSLFQAIKGVGPDGDKFIDDFINSLVKIVEVEISRYIADMLELITPHRTYQDVSDFNKRVSVKLYHSERVKNVVPYGMYRNSRSWAEIPLISEAPGHVTFETARTGNFILLAREKKEDGISEKAALKNKWQKIGLGDTVNFDTVYGKVTRQELAGILIDFLCRRTGIDMAKYRPGKSIYITDEKDIDNKYYKPVLMSIEYRIMQIKEGRVFEPDSKVKDNEFITALDRLVGLLEK
jgi:hypothetical protein